MNPKEIKPGTVIAEFIQVDELLGRGGMGLVYKATHLWLQRPIALKLSEAIRHDDKDSRSRFKREAYALSQLSHRNIVGFYSFGLWQGLIPYIAMEYLEGVSLDKFLRDQPTLKPERIKTILLQVVDALAAAHQHGIIHRDLKPGNIMLLDSPAEDLVKLLDFGLAHLASEQSSLTQNLTRTGALIGTVFYMSPEQCRGEKVDERSDIYSLGCIIYEILSTRPPFSGDSAFVVMQKHLSEKPVAIDSSIIGKCREYEHLASIASRCLEKEPKDRYQNMEAIAADLHNLSGEISAPALQKDKSISLLALSLLALFVVGSCIATSDTWLSYFEAQYIERVADRAAWQFGIEQAQKLNVRGKLAESVRLLTASLSAAKQDKAPPVRLAVIELELASLMKRRGHEQDASAHASAAFHDLVKAVETTKWELLESTDFKDQVNNTLSFLLVQAHKDAAIMADCESLFKVLHEKRESSLLISLAKLELAIALQTSRMGELGAGLTKQLLLAQCYLDANMRQEAVAELTRIIAKGLQAKRCPQAVASALKEYVTVLPAAEKASLLPQFLDDAESAKRIFDADKITEPISEKLRFLLDLAQFYLACEKKEQAKALCLEAESLLRKERLPEDIDYWISYYAESFSRLVKLWAALQDKQGIKRNAEQVTNTYMTWKSAANFPFQKYIANLEQLSSHGFEKEADDEFDCLIRNRFSEGNCPDLGYLLFKTYEGMGVPSKTLYYEDRIINLRRKQKNTFNLIVALDSKCNILMLLNRRAEALNSILDLARFKDGQSSADWNLISNSLWRGVLLLLVEEDTKKAKQLLADFKPPKQLMNQQMEIMIDWCELIIAAREGRAQAFNDLMARLESSFETESARKENQFWFRMAKIDLLISQGKNAEAEELFLREPCHFSPENWASSLYASVISKRLSRDKNK